MFSHQWSFSLLKFLLSFFQSLTSLDQSLFWLLNLLHKCFHLFKLKLLDLELNLLLLFLLFFLLIKSKICHRTSCVVGLRIVALMQSKQRLSVLIIVTAEVLLLRFRKVLNLDRCRLVRRFREGKSLRLQRWIPYVVRRGQHKVHVRSLSVSSRGWLWFLHWVFVCLNLSFFSFNLLLLGLQLIFELLQLHVFLKYFVSHNMQHFYLFTDCFVDRIESLVFLALGLRSLMILNRSFCLYLLCLNLFWGNQLLFSTWEISNELTGGVGGS